MMDENQLRRYFLFRRLGAFSVDRNDRRSFLQTIDYAVDLLSSEAPCALWIYPQGRILPNDLRPMRFHTGIAKIIQKANNPPVVPIAVRYEFLGEYKPEIFVKIYSADDVSSFPSDSRKRTAELFADKLSDCLDSLKEDINLDRTRNYLNLI